MLASVVLTDMTEIAAKIYHDDAFAGQLRALASEVKEAIDKYALVPGHKKEFYAYEVDGYGQYHIMDDANIPGLLSMRSMATVRRTTRVTSVQCNLKRLESILLQRQKFFTESEVHILLPAVYG